MLILEKCGLESLKDKGKLVSNFLMESQCGNIYWRKYEEKSWGSGQNYLYIGREKITLTQWLFWSEEDRKVFYEEAIKID